MPHLGFERKLNIVDIPQGKIYLIIILSYLKSAFQNCTCIQYFVYSTGVYIDTIIDNTFRTYFLEIYEPFGIDHDIVISHRFGGNVLL